jgi:pimeloyl-ACP methyl ester carboxylesterase
MTKSLLAQLALALLVAALPGDAAAARNQVENSYKHPVDIGGGRHLNMICTGTGAPTVVFLQTLGGNMLEWRRVLGPVTALTRACFYDRAGFGYSDRSAEPVTADNVANDLHALLRAAKIDDRVVLVGASLGGLFATYYADKFGSDVAGLVLVDPSFSGQFDYPVSARDAKMIEDDDNAFPKTMRACAKLAEDGKLSKGNPHDCFAPPLGDLTQDEAGYVMDQVRLPSYYASLLSEFENLNSARKVGKFVDGVNGEQERRMARDFGDLPLIVLTGHLMSHGMMISDAAKSAAQEVWERGHDALARRSTRGESIILPDTGHVIALQKPERVVEAIRKVVTQARH